MLGFEGVGEVTFVPFFVGEVVWFVLFGVGLTGVVAFDAGFVEFVGSV